MSPSAARSKIPRHSSPLRTSRYFPPADSLAETVKTSSEMSRPKRASTAGNGSVMDPLSSGDAERDAFEGRISEETSEPPRQSVDLEDLPIELIGLADSFIDSLSAKVHPTPPSIDNLSQLFQDFYFTAAQHIHTHISIVASRQKYENSPTPINSTRASAASILRAKAASLGSRDKSKPVPLGKEAEQQMLTAEEVAERRRQRKLLEQKRSLYEEAVERRLCEGIYDKIYRHRTTQDEAQDGKLRSKTAALAVVGIGLADLGVDLGDAATPEASATRQEEVKAWLEEARKELVLMNESRYPLGKLNHLKAAHKSIIDTLAHFHPSSSADELMPMLIYTLITMPPERLNVISDINFIQRFRWEPKLMGETAYCLTTLEATVSFLETVDLSTLRADEAPEGPLKSSSGPGISKAATFPPAYDAPSMCIKTTSASPETPGVQRSSTKSTPSPSNLQAAQQLQNRRLSDLMNTPVQAIGAASDAMDQSLKTITNSLGDSYKFLLGKLREHPEGLTNAGEGVVVPKTLEDARKLIGTPPPNDDDGSASGASSTHSPEETERHQRRSAQREEKVLSLIGGRRSARDRSVDSSGSVGSSRDKEKVVAGTSASAGATGSGSTSTLSSNPALIDSMRSFGNSLNPMARLSGFRAFGRTGSSTAIPASKEPAQSAKVADGGDLATAFPELTTALPPKEPLKISPPIRKFLELRNPADLKLREVLELLKDYQRLAGALKNMGAFKE